MRDKSLRVLAVAFVLVQSLTAQPPPQDQVKRIARLVEQLGDLDLDKQNDAAQQLETLSELARPALLAAMARHKDGEVRLQAGAVLKRLNASKVNRLVNQLSEAADAKRLAAEKELSKIVTGDKTLDEQMQSAEAARRLFRVQAKHPDKNVRASAGRALTDGWRARVRELIKQLGDESFDVREAATKALVKIGLPAVEELKKATTNSVLETRNRAKHTLEAITKDQ